MKTGIIYKATSPSGKVYIGKTTQGLIKRINQHFFGALNINSDRYHTHFSNALRKYGRGNVIWVTLHKSILHSELNKLEIITIAEYNSYNEGYNSTKGGDGTVGIIVSSETKAKISATLKGHVKSKETCAKLSASLRGHKMLESTKASLLIANTGRVISKETRLKKSISMKGKPSPMKGRRHKDSSKIKISNAVSGESNPSAKLNWTKVSEIRALHIKGHKNIDISKTYNVSSEQISRIINNKSWKIKK